MITIKVKNIDGLRSYLKNIKTGVSDGFKEGLPQAAFFVEKEVKESIAGNRKEIKSVDTGRFLNSVETSIGTTDAVIFTTLEYSKYLEWGSSRISARGHFRNTGNRNRNKIKEYFEEKIKEKI